MQRLATLFVSVKIINLEREPNRTEFTFFPRKNHKRTEKTVKQATTQLTKTVITIHHSVERIFVSFVFTWNFCWKINQLWLHKMFNSLSFSLSLQSRRIANDNEGQSNEIVSLTHLVFKIQCQLVLFCSWWRFPTSFWQKTKTRWSWWVWRSTGQEIRWQKTQQTIPSDTLMLIRSVDKPTNQFGENGRRAKTQAENKKKKKTRRSKMIRKVIEKITTRPSISLFRSCP